MKYQNIFTKFSNFVSEHNMFSTFVFVELLYPRQKQNRASQLQKKRVSFQHLFYFVCHLIFSLLSCDWKTTLIVLLFSFSSFQISDLVHRVNLSKWLFINYLVSSLCMYLQMCVKNFCTSVWFFAWSHFSMTQYESNIQVYNYLFGKFLIFVFFWWKTHQVMIKVQNTEQTSTSQKREKLAFLEGKLSPTTVSHF